MAPTSTARLERLPDLSTAEVRRQLKPRPHPYWHRLWYGRFLGYAKNSVIPTRWFARYHRKDGRYRQMTVGSTDDQQPANGTSVLTFHQALEAAQQRFRTTEISADASDPNPIGRKTSLLYCPVGQTYTFGHALQDYLEWKRLRSAATHFNVIVALINYHILFRFGPVAIDELRGELFREYFQEVLETPPKHGKRPVGERRPLFTWDNEALRKRKKTVNALITILRDTLQLAWQNSKTDNDRLWRSLRTFPNVDRPRMVHLSRPECRVLLKTCRPDLRRLVLGALYTGCRSLELLRMRVCDVGRDGYGGYVLPSKTCRPRFVFLPDEGMAFFLSLIRNKPAQSLLFLRDNGHPWSEYHRHLFRAAIRKAGLPEDFSFHGLRHTYASQLVQAGAPLTVISEQLGHVNTVTVSRTYGHVSPQIRESDVRQRFTVLEAKNARAADEQKRMLARWRSSLHGSDWRTYARIGDLSSVRN